jgi:imidazolonepropionase-like amidohydrolase
MTRPLLLFASVLLFAACATTSEADKPSTKGEADKASAADKPVPLPLEAQPTPPGDPAPAPAAPAVILRGGKVMTAAGVTFDKGHVVLEGGRITRVGNGPGEAPAGARVIDVTGKVITPGLIDTHSHIGVYPWPSAQAHSDGNEATAPVTSEVWAEHSFWPQDPAIWRALTGGITTIQVLPGSANLIGGRSFVAKLRPGVSARAMRFQGAPQGLKMACGENPKRVYGGKGRNPSTRMGNMAARRAVFHKAWEHRRRLQKYERDLAHYTAQLAEAKDDAAKKKLGDPPEAPSTNLQLDTLVKVLDGEILVHTHCYRADDMSRMLDVAEEFNFSIRSFHHALEAYKIRDRLAATNTASSTWADWWGFKMEAYDGIPYNAAMLEEAGARAIIHSDGADEIRRLNQEAAKARAAGREVGIEIDDDTILRWVTLNPAWALGVDDQVGTLEVGKQADVVVWSGSPFSVYSTAERVFIDGAEVYDASRQAFERSDFEIGQRGDPAGHRAPAMGGAR